MKKRVYLKREYKVIKVSSLISKNIRKAALKIMPKFKEETLFAVSLTVLILDLLNQKLFFLHIFDIPFLILALIAYLLSIFFALTPRKLSKGGLLFTFIVGIIFLTELHMGVLSSFYFFQKYFKLSESSSLLDNILMFFGIAGVAHSVLIAIIFRAELVRLEEIYISGNADKRILAICTIIIIIVVLWGKYCTNYLPEVIGSTALGFCNIVIGSKNLLEMRKEG